MKYFQCPIDVINIYESKKLSPQKNTPESVFPFLNIYLQLLSVISSPSLSNNSNLNLTRISHLRLDFLRDIE